MKAAPDAMGEAARPMGGAPQTPEGEDTRPASTPPYPAPGAGASAERHIFARRGKAGTPRRMPRPSVSYG
jgi:hypothetical protein